MYLLAFDMIITAATGIAFLVKYEMDSGFADLYHRTARRVRHATSLGPVGFIALGAGLFVYFLAWPVPVGTIVRYEIRKRRAKR